MDVDSWGTWQPDRPAELQHLASGFTLTPTLYSDRGNRFSMIPANQGFQFGVRSFDAKTIAFTTSLEQTVLDWRYDLATNGDAIIDWQAIRHGEWGLRFWVSLAIQGPDGCTFVYDRDEAVLRGELPNGAARLEIRSAKAPLLVTFHDDLDALRQEYEQHGYFYLASRGTNGHFATLRFNLEEAPTMRVVAALGATARPTLPAKRVDKSASPAVTPQPRVQQSLQAIYDVMSWNHVFDRINNRPYTCLTRNWNTQKFGGFGVWMNDILYNALLWSYFDTAKAKQNIEAVFVWQTDDGNFPCLVTGNDAWLDRSQPPIAAYVVWALFQRSADLDFLAWAYPRLLRNYDWWWRRRTLAGTGLVAYGTSLDVGDGLYKGTKLAAKDESSMDNMPVHDPAPFNEKTGMLESNDVGLNSLLAIDAQVLLQMSQVLGQATDAARLQAQSAAHKERIREWLWDTERGVFANRLLNGDFVDAIAPTSFFPLAAGVASEAQTEAMIAAFLKPRHKFGGDFGLPSVTRDHPAYHDNVYWRGRVWAPLNYWVYHGLCRAGRPDKATALANMSSRLFHLGWQQRLCGENYNAETGAINDQADTDAFYSWGALLPAIAIAEITDVTPWRGMTLAPSRVEGKLGPVIAPVGRITINNRQGVWDVQRDGKPWIRGNVDGEFSQITQTTNAFIANLPPMTTPAWLEFIDESVNSADVDGVAVSIAQGKVHLERGGEGRQLRARFHI